MGLKITKETERDLYLSFTDTQRLSKNIIAQLLGCDPSIVLEAAQQEGVQMVLGPKKIPDLSPVEQCAVKDFPHIIHGLQKIKTKPDGFQWVEGIDTSKNGGAKMLKHMQTR